MNEDDINTLDFNKTSKRKTRFSTTKVKQQFENQDIVAWAALVDYSKQGIFAYPSSLQDAIIHQQSCYLLPDEDFVLKNKDVDQCKCCGQRIKKKRVNYFTADLYELLVSDYGITIPLYFTFLKLHFFLLILVGLVFGLFFGYQSSHMCRGQSDDITCYNGERYYFLPQDIMLENIQNTNLTVFYYAIGFVVYLIIIITPFIHEIIMRSTQIKYWQYDPWNHIKFNKLSVYVKHLPRKMTEEEIQQNIFQALKSEKVENPQKLSRSNSSKPKTLLVKENIHGNSRSKTQHTKSLLFTPDQHAIDELLYIYDIHPIAQLNQKRVETFLQLLQISMEIKQLSQTPELGQSDEQEKSKQLSEIQSVSKLTERFIALVTELMIQTKEIQLYLQEGLPYTNKVIIKLKTEEQTEAVYNHYKKGCFEMIQSRVKVLWSSRNELKSQQELQNRITTQADQSFSESEISEIQIDGQKSKSVNMMYLENPSPFHDEQHQDIEQPFPLNKSLHHMIETDDFLTLEAYTRLEELKRQQQAKENKDIHIQRGFREDDIFWENIGMHTLKRFLLRLMTFMVSIIASLLCMGLFQYAFIYQNDSKQKSQNSDGQQSLFDVIFINFLTVVIVFLAILATVIVMLTTIRSRRSTYTLQEMNIINFMSFMQVIFILSFPYFLVISFWKGLTDSISIYNLFVLGRIRIILKGLAHIFHVRQVSFWLRKRKITKDFIGANYFQMQLNNLMTPGMFPLRSRLLYTYFVFSTGYLMVFLAPWILLICLSFQLILFYYDKYTLFRVYTIDKRFTFQLMQYLISSYQTIMTPIYIYIYLAIFQKKVGVVDSNIPQIAGLSVGLLSWILYIFFRNQIADFWVFKIRRMHRPIRDQNRIFEEKTYFQSYQDYFSCKIT